MHLLLFIFSLILLSCRTVKNSDFKIEETPSAQKLPLLIPDANINELIDIVVSKLYYKATGNVTLEAISPRRTSLEYDLNIKQIPEHRVHDMLKLFVIDVKQNISKADGNPLGSIELELLSYKEKNEVGLTIFSLWFLGTLNLLGFPLEVIRTTMEPKITIYNRNKRIIGEYQAEGSGVAYLAMYWGYGQDVWRKANILAFKDAMNKIRSQIQSENARLSAELQYK